MPTWSPQMHLSAYSSVTSGDHRMYTKVQPTLTQLASHRSLDRNPIRPIKVMFLSFT